MSNAHSDATSIELSLLPDELIMVISAELPTASAYALKHVNKRFHGIVRGRVSFSADNVLKSAAYYGYLQIIKWINPSGSTQPIRLHQADYGKQIIMAYACRGGDSETVKWLYYAGYPLFNGHKNYAVFSGNIDLIEWKEFDPCIDDTYLCVAAALGNTSVLERAHHYGRMSGDIMKLAMYAAITGQIDTLIYLTTVNAKLPECISIMDVAVYNDQLETVRWLISTGHSAQTAYDLAIYLKRTSITDMVVDEHPDKVDTSANDIILYQIVPQYDVAHPDFVLNEYALDLSMC